MKLLTTAFIGLVFGIGISISGMIDPAKVLNFFDIFGSWDPSLAFVMGGALIITFFGYRWAWRRAKPLYGHQFQVPTSTHIDSKLVGGSAMFGVGWGIAGFCPGAAIPAVGTGRWEAILFVVAVIGGISIRKFFLDGVKTTLLR